MGFLKDWINNRRLRKEKEQREFNEIVSEEEPKKEFCDFKGCKKKLRGLDDYPCKYCHKEFCDKHRTPEEHKCEGNPTTPSQMKHGGQKYSSEGTSSY